MELPTHPEADDGGSSSGRPSAGSRTGWLIPVLIGALVVLMIVLHLTGVVGPGAD